MTEVDAEAVS